MSDDASARYSAGLDHILELVVLLNDDMVQTLAREGLTPSRAHLLWELAQRGPTTQKTLADALKVSARNVTGLVDALADTGFVTREPHPTDRRATLVSFTERGAAMVESMRRDQKMLANLLFEGMPAERFECFIQGLDDVLARLYAHGVEHSGEVT